MEKSVIKLFRYTISVFIIFATLHVNGASDRTLDNILVSIKLYADILSNAQTTIQREEAKDTIEKKAKQLVGASAIMTAITVSDVKMKDKNTATISFSKIDLPSFEPIKNEAAFRIISPSGRINLSITENTAKSIITGQKLVLHGKASFHQHDNFAYALNPYALVRLDYKYPVSGSGTIRFIPTAYRLENQTQASPLKQPQRMITPTQRTKNAKPSQASIKVYKQPVKSKPIDLKTYTDEYISFNYPSSWKVMTMHTNNFSKVTCAAGKEIFSVTYCYSKFDPIDTINAWVNKCHIPEISRQAIHTSKVSGSSVNTCYYYTKVNKFVHTGCVKVFNTSTGNTVIIHKQAESKKDMTSPTGPLCNIEKSFKLVSVNQQK